MPVPIQYRPAGAQKIGSTGKDAFDIGHQGRLADAKTFCWQALRKRFFKVRQASSTRPPPVRVAAGSASCPERSP